jgi:hypothetical protein
MNKILAYVVDEENQVHPIPRSRYARILKGEEAVYLYAGRVIRFVETIVNEQPEGAPAFAHALFPLVYFDAEGRRDKGKQAHELYLTQKAFASSEEGGWEELYFEERDAAFRWKPTAQVLQQLRQAVPRKRAS